MTRPSLRPLRTIAVLSLILAAHAPPARCLPRAAELDDHILDSPLVPGLVPALGTAWLLDPHCPPPPAAWPLPRHVWRNAPSTPTLSWLSRARPWSRPDDAAAARGLLAIRSGDFAAALDPRLELATWRLDGDADGSLAEAGNGLEAEAIWAGRAAFWLHVRDMGLEGDLDRRFHPLWREDDRWLWEQSGDGTLTHDESRAGATLWGQAGATSTWQISLGSDHLHWGTGTGRSVLIRGEQAPAVSHLRLSLESGRLSLLQIVGELASGEAGTIMPNPQHPADPKVLPREKWLVAHRLEWRGDQVALGLGEAVVVGDRRPGPGYLVPAGFLWSQQHAQGDLDNTLLFADLRWRLPARLPGAWMLSGELAVDDYTLGEWGRALEGQRTASRFALDGCPLPVWRRGDGRIGGMKLGSLALPGLGWLGVQHTRARPYFGAHRWQVSQWSHGHATLGPFDDPNTRATEWRWRHEWSADRPLVLPGLRADPLILISANHFHLVHGANPAGRNVGGDRALAHREGVDEDEAPFLAGHLEKRRGIELGCSVGLLLSTASGRDLGVLRLEADWIQWRREGEEAATRVEGLSSWRLSWARPF